MRREVDNDVAHVYMPLDVEETCHLKDQEQGRPALPMLVQYFCDRVWRSLCDLDADGSVQTSEVDEFFDLADTDGNGELLGALDIASC